jgi:tetratricopeptide (TPR) repeat protein
MAGAAAALALAICLAWSALLGWEDYLARGQTREAIGHAIRLVPGDARNYTALASLGGASRTPALERAVAINPFDSMSWVELGLDMEMRGNHARAERCLLQAARVDKTYAPRWALANFYFRADNPREFWPWLREAARMSYGDARPLAGLAWNLAEDAPEGLDALGGRAPVLAAYASLLLDKGRTRPAEAAANRLIERGGREALGWLLVDCDRFLEAGQPGAALRLWNRMAEAKLIAVPKLNPERGPWLTNADFASEPLSRGFDWRMQRVTGVESVRLPGTDGLRIRFSGEQPEDCMLLLQRFPVAPGRSWRLIFEYRTAGTSPRTGLRWRTLGAEWQAPASETWREAAFQFKAPPAASVLPLVLAYARMPGTVRMAGSFWLRRVRLEPAGQ